MRSFFNFKDYVPSAEDKINLITFGVKFLISKDNQDWYESQSLFSEYTLKAVFNSDKVITDLSYDVSSLWPIDQSVIELSPDTIPDGIDKDGNWVINIKTGKAEKRVYTEKEISSQIQNKIQSDIADVMSLINPLQFAIDLEMATEEEKTKLKNLQKYVVLLNRVPLQDSYPTGVNWPEIPTT